MISTGTVYATLYSMERKGLIKGLPKKKKIAYTVTEKGEDTESCLCRISAGAWLRSEKNF
jgi:hypothetical protein